VTFGFEREGGAESVLQGGAIARPIRKWNETILVRRRNLIDTLNSIH